MSLFNLQLLWLVMTLAQKRRRGNLFPDEEDKEELIPTIALINSQQVLKQLIERRSENEMVKIEELEIPELI